MRHGVAAIALLCASGAVLAQTAPEPPPPRHGQHHAWEQRMEQHRMDQLTILLDLTPAQQQAVKTILSSEHARMRQSLEQAMQQVRDTHRAVHKETVDKLSAVLSPAQMKKFNALMPEGGMMQGMMMHGMMMHGMGHDMDMGPHGPGPGPAPQ
jgi:Spy/CpxP family protein refolding chaperone